VEGPAVCQFSHSLSSPCLSSIRHTNEFFSKLLSRPMGPSRQGTLRSLIGSDALRKRLRATPLTMLVGRYHTP
jgi:hypothetical protein